MHLLGCASFNLVKRNAAPCGWKLCSFTLSRPCVGQSLSLLYFPSVNTLQKVIIMRFPPCSVLLSGLIFLARVSSLASTDTIQDMDAGQSGYRKRISLPRRSTVADDTEIPVPNHNMDPGIVDSAQFGQLWKKQFNNLEQVGAECDSTSRQAANPRRSSMQSR